MPFDLSLRIYVHFVQMYKNIYTNISIVTLFVRVKN